MAFKEELETYFEDFFTLVATENGDWTVKGFIDVYKNIYTISVDTKVVSKIIELMIFPVILKFAGENNYEMFLSAHQNHYPDITFIDKDTGEKIALDLKSTYKISPTQVNGMTLGAFTGYFRKRNTTKNITFKYSEYSQHFILGVIYSKSDLFQAEELIIDLGFKKITNTIRKLIGKYLSNQSDDDLEALTTALKIPKGHELQDKIQESIDSCIIDERIKYELDDLPNILSVVRDFEFFVQEKWKIANARPGSGNTKNIGSSTSIDQLKNGNGPFTKLKDGKKIFDDYWMYYMTKDMAKAVDLEKPPYSNLKEYFEYKEIDVNEITI